MADFPEYHGISLAPGSYIQNFTIEQLVSDPVPLTLGKAWFNTTEKVWKYTTLDAANTIIVRTFTSVEALSAEVAMLNAIVRALDVKCSNANVTAVAASIESVLLLSPNPARRSFSIVNNSVDSDLRINFGDTASNSLFTFYLEPKDAILWETFPYTGPISGIWSVAEGAAQIMELTD